MDAAVQLANIYLIASTQDAKNGPELIEEGSTLCRLFPQGVSDT